MVFPRDENGEGEDPSLEALNEQIAREVAAANQRPDPEMGGLSPDQVFRLLHTEWGAAGEMIQFNDDVALDLLN